MLSEALFSYLLSNNYSYGLDDSMNSNNDSLMNDGNVPKVRTKTLYRREPALSDSVTLLIEL